MSESEETICSEHILVETFLKVIKQELTIPWDVLSVKMITNASHRKPTAKRYKRYWGKWTLYSLLNHAGPICMLKP